MKGRPVIVHVHPGATSFVLKDRRLLASQFEVRDHPFVWKRKWEVVPLMLRQLIRLAFTRWDVVVVQFGGYHALFPALVARLTRRACVIITGGTDCVSFPSIGYGNFAKQPLAIVTRWGYAMADAIVPVHTTLVKSRNTYQQGDPPEQGLLTFMPKLRTPIHVVPNGYASDSWPLGTGHRDIDVISVAAGDRRPSTMRLKGIDLIIEAARSRPGLRFIIIGLREAPDPELPANIRFLGPMPNNELVFYYQRAKIYAQLSLSEGFPNALCEAMLCGCVPLVSAVGAMPDIVGDRGSIIERRDLSQLLRSLDALVHAVDSGMALQTRMRISSMYTEERRAQELCAAIRNVLI